MIGSLIQNLFMVHPAILPYYFILTINVADIPRQFLGTPPPASILLDHQQNAVWLEHIWLQDGNSDQEIEALGDKLNRYSIRYIYPHLTPSDENGHLPPFSAEAARRFQKIIHRKSPQVRILPWVGGVRFGFRQTHPGTVRLDSDSYLQTFAGECAYLTDQLGFDGVHVNIEPVDSGNRKFLEWLEYVKSRIGTNKVLSVAANKPSFVDGLDPGALRSWDMKYFGDVSSFCDQIVVMNYDTGISNPVLYSLFIKEKLGSILKSITTQNASCQVLLGVPTYDNGPRHKSDAENVSSAVLGVLAALGDREIPSRNFSGLAIYGYWTTSELEWKELADQWQNTSSK